MADQISHRRQGRHHGDHHDFPGLWLAALENHKKGSQGPGQYQKAHGHVDLMLISCAVTIHIDDNGHNQGNQHGDDDGGHKGALPAGRQILGHIKLARHNSITS